MTFHAARAAPESEPDNRDEIQQLGPWFHNLHLPDGRQTMPDHHFGDFPRCKWDVVRAHLPQSLAGRRALDIGCNAGFYSFELARLGAEVTGIDHNPHYLRQAMWAAEKMGVTRASFRQNQVYDLAHWRERFDVILFMGVFYHLRYPLLALDILARLKPEILIFQTLTADTGMTGGDPKPSLDFSERQRLTERDWPFMAFIEGDFCGDPTNWWAPNHAAVCALLRSAGFDIAASPGEEIYVCRSAPAQRCGALEDAEFTAATGAVGGKTGRVRPGEEER